MTFREFVEEKYENEKTINGYIKDVELFKEFLNENKIKDNEVKHVNIKQYQIKLTEMGYSNHTIARKISSLRLYFKYLRKSGVMENNPLEDVKQPILEKRDDKLSEEKWNEIKILLEGKERDLLMMYFIYKEKIKIKELIEIRVKDYNKEQGILYLKKRAISLEEETKEILNTYLGEKEEEKFIFESSRESKLTEPGAYFIIKTYLKKVGCENLRPIDLVK